jgi:hypothetical protein
VLASHRRGRSCRQPTASYLPEIYYIEKGEEAAAWTNAIGDRPSQEAPGAHEKTSVRVAQPALLHAHPRALSQLAEVRRVTPDNQAATALPRPTGWVAPMEPGAHRGAMIATHSALA